jgi:serine/threonine-protein kinase
MKYETAILLGEGGMGKVYRAFDPALQRDVALKFLRGDDPVMVERLLREARLQALVDHPHVCKVYEVGESEGRPYIAMQYVEGEGLGAASETMPLRQKVEVMEVVADAVHAAHRVGLIHRDLKPGNILLERREEGRVHPYVLDFGLAREAEAPGLTETGVAMGTPPFMAPEQARGEVRRLDRRTDVYALGAVLYAVIAGRPPFEGRSTVEILIKVLNEDPVPPRRWNPEIPPDLETIVMKCLEKEPGRRYETARALAGDLRSFLDGEPLAARPVSAAHRILRRVRKNKAVVAATLIGLIAATTLGAMWLRAGWESEERARLAQRFGQEVERIDGIMRQAHLLPLHDIRPDKARIRERMKAIETETPGDGGLDEAAGHYALGRGHMALGEFEAARREIEAAWNGGYREPEAAYARGRILGALYQRALAERSRIPDKESPDRRAVEIDRTLREPALLYLRASAGLRTESSAYVEALIAFYERRFPHALERARAAHEAVPGLFEARRLEGDIYVALGSEKHLRGDHDAALADFSSAERAYTTASDMARSDPEIYEGECGLRMRMALLEWSRGGDPSEGFASAIAACDRSIQTDPERAEAYYKKGECHGQWADYLDAYHRDPETQIRSAVEASEKALAFNPKHAAALLTLGDALVTRAHYGAARGRDPGADLDEAVRRFAQAARLQEEGLTYDAMGRALKARAEYERPRGVDPRPSLRQAVAAYRKAVALKPDYAYALNNEGNAWEMIAEYEVDHGIDPGPSVEQAVKDFRTAIDLNPKFTWAFGNIGAAYWCKGVFELGRGQDPRDSIRRAIESYEVAIQSDPKYANARANLGEAYLSLATYLLESGGDPSQALKAGRSALREAVELDPEFANAYLLSGRMETISARMARSEGLSPEPSLTTGLAALGRAMKLDPGDGDPFAAQAELYRWKAEWRLSKRESPAADLDLGLAAARKATDINPLSSTARAVQGALLTLQARFESDAAKKETAAREAEASFERAFEMNRLLEREYGRLRDEARSMSSDPASTGSRR